MDVISFGAGEPDFDTPERVKEAAIQAMRNGHTKYTEVGGIPELRAAACAKFKRDNGLDYEPADVLVSCGAKHTLYNIFVALLDPGDEVLVPSPYWVSYPEQVRLLDGVPVPVTTREEAGFDLDPKAVAAAVTPRTKLIVLNSPGNPTGAVFSPATLEAVARLAVARNVWIISDECYGVPHVRGPPRLRRVVRRRREGAHIVVNTCSKAVRDEGWRSRLAAARARSSGDDGRAEPGDLDPSSIAQWAAVEALTGPQDEVAKMAGEFDRRRRLIVDGLNALPGVRCATPKGAFYAFPNVSGLLGKRRPAARRSPARATSRASCSRTRASPSCPARTLAPTSTCACRTRRARS